MRGIRTGMTLIDADGIYLGVVSEVVVPTIGRGYLVAGCVSGRSWRVPLALVRWVLDGAVRLSVPRRLLHSVDAPPRSR
jgi:hypothetical protein